jgi:hypothetical protein
MDSRLNEEALDEAADEREAARYPEYAFALLKYNL